MPPEPPLPVAARFFTAAEILEVDFDHVLQPGPIDGPNWQGILTTWLWRGQVGIPGTVAGRTAYVPMTQIAPDIGGDDCDYNPPPFDVMSRSSTTPAVGFANFPVNVLP